MGSLRATLLRNLTYCKLYDRVPLPYYFKRALRPNLPTALPKPDTTSTAP